MRAETGPRLVHPALAAGPGVALADARLTDRQRVAVLLQGCAVLSHLAQAGCRLVGAGWDGARVGTDGLLHGLRPEGGREADLPQALVLRLVAELFGPGPVAGRGEARRAVRCLLGAWRQSLVPLDPDEAVAQILDAAGFLWEAPFGPARSALAAVLEEDGARRSWIAGPGPFRSRVLAAAPDPTAAAEALAGPAARALWDGVAPGEEPTSLVACRRWRAAVAAWSRRPPVGPDERLALARAWFALGKFERAEQTLRGSRDQAARVLRVACQSRLGKLGGARVSLQALERATLSPAETIEAAEVAVRVYANSGDPARAKSWVERARAAAAASAVGRRGVRARRPRAVSAGAAASNDLAARAELVAAAAAWDSGDLEEMERVLAEVGIPAADPDLTWRWLHCRGLLAIARRDGPAAVEALGAALRRDRRRLTRVEAGALWNDLTLGRALAGDLAGAERACLHAVHLLGGCEGPQRTTLALCNLAEIRLRRGRTRGVREILERSSAENRAAGNWRGGIQDLELWARLELVEGRPAAALARLRDARAELERRGLDWRRAELAVLAARALGLLGRAAEAAEELRRTTGDSLAELEPEERPAVWALAGDREGALREAGDGRFGPLWGALLRGEDPGSEWARLAELEPGRAARLVLDAELVAPGLAPPSWVRRAAAAFRSSGAGAWADRLEGRDNGPWLALAGYFEQPSPGRLGGLLAAAGYPEARLVWRSGGREEVLADGRGGSDELAIEAGDGALVLTAPGIDSALRALFAFAAREFRPPGGVEPRRPAIGGLVGESPALRQALARLSRLAARDVPILILGESGTGKELVARQVHALSARHRGSLLPINCAALSESLLLSDLFGHVRGAFTGADRDRAGVFEAARGGTVFLDEIGDLPPSAQGMLLRVLQEGEVRRLGESVARRVDVRVVAATHRDLERMVAEGGFRQDLYYRLKVGSVALPPLRERGRDVLLLAEAFLAAGAVGTTPAVAGTGHRLSSAAAARLMAHRWPGNVRELRNVLAVAEALADGGVIRPEHLDLPEPRGTAAEGGYHRMVEEFRRRLVRDALEAVGGNRAEAARRLGLSRQALSYLVRQLGLV